MTKTNDFKYKILFINVDDNKDTQEAIAKLGYTNVRLRAIFTANKNLMICVKNKTDLDAIWREMKYF